MKNKKSITIKDYSYFLCTTACQKIVLLHVIPFVKTFVDVLLFACILWNGWLTLSAKNMLINTNTVKKPSLSKTMLLLSIKEIGHFSIISICTAVYLGNLQYGYRARWCCLVSKGGPQKCTASSHVPILTIQHIEIFYNKVF